MMALRGTAARLRRWARQVGPFTAVALGVGGLLALAAAALATYTAVELARFARTEATRRTLVYAAGQPLVPGISIRAVDLAGTLSRLRYRETTGMPAAPGEFRRTAAAWDLYVRGFEEDQGQAPTRVRLELKGDRIARVLRERQPVDGLRLEAEVLPSGDRGEDYRPVRLADVPPSLQHAVLAAEDHRFFEHAGVDLRGLLRAAWVNLRSGRVSQGGSTITQQLVKNRLVGSRRTLGRKLREAWLAAAVEWRYSKAEILESYLNEAYLGQHGSLAVRGVGAAARAYLGKEIHQLTLGEAALLAGMIRAPNSYSPVLDPDRARQRRDVVLARMRELGHISDAEYAAARAEPIRVQVRPSPGRRAPYFTDYVQQEIEQRIGDTADEPDGVRVYTTLDLTLQRFAETAVARGLERLEARRPRLRRPEPAQRLQAVLVALEPDTGHVLALVGGRDYQVSQFNRALLARRQPGSAFKPFVYLAALRARRGGPAFTAASFVDDEPITLTVNGEPWTPRNYEDHYAGRVSVRRALELSLNAATVRIAQEVGLPEVIEAARALGIESPLRPVPAMALGAFEVTPLELARAYLPLANGGRRLDRVAAVRVVYDAHGTTLVVAEPESRPVISAAESYLMTSLLQGVMTAGTGATARGLGVTAPVAGKTGTTNDARDAWFVGYTPHLLALVWVGFDGGEAHGLSAADAALPIWADFMRQALDAYPAPAVEMPAGVSVVDIDSTNGRRATRFCPVVAREVFLEGSEPPPCEEHGWFGEQVIDWWRRLRDWFRR
ncbi:MAG TPA: PBP1A family penicillin-binding protein [Candidatus Binatia bacterium]|nr:PBP1A family penicillin-binding protein [Candidatus Binatia bacterium]